MFHSAPGLSKSDEHLSVPDDVLLAYSGELGELIDEVSARIVEELGCIVSDKAAARHLVTGKSFWRAQLVLGLAKRNGSLTDRHLDVAIAIEMLDLAFDTHIIGTLKALGLHKFDMGVDEGKMVLAGDYYLTRAATSALKSDRIETLRQVASIMSAIPSGHIIELENPAVPYGVVRKYVRSRRYFFGRVTSACVKASLAESNVAFSTASDVDGLAALTASAISSRRDWMQRTAFPDNHSWDLPLLIALREQPPHQRQSFVSRVSSKGKSSKALIVDRIADTQALQINAILSQNWASRATVSLARMFPSAARRTVAPPVYAVAARQ